MLLATMALGVAMSFGHAAADGPDAGYGAREVGTVRFIDRALNLIQLEDGTELRTTDARMLQNIKEGMHPTGGPSPLRAGIWRGFLNSALT